ncbi:MAG: DUF2934 domain-containing protein [Methylobacterium sp.]|uniref:DUF2934 domain-containing protein n=1 Tax=Methylobacterium sp. TaxID=409 RepID=UPI0025895E96|nr:DUF2934 domain-containing protein [Methylobacterium sp.]MBY0299003.1 DUF2934 domain-containing protein [Methylobacterium sp.]
MDHFEHSVRERAYALWEQDGRTMGRDEHYWRLAEQELQQAVPAAKPVTVQPKPAKASPKAAAKAPAKEATKSPVKTAAKVATKAAETVKAAPKRRRAPAAEGAVVH